MQVLLAQSDWLPSALFYAFAVAAAASAVGVVVSRNIVRTAVCLMFALSAVAGLYFTLEAEFLAAVQLVVYVGGTLILIIFGVMLTSKSPFARFQPKPAEVVVALVIGAIMLTGLIIGIQAALTKGAFSGTPMPATDQPVLKLGQALLGDYLVPFEIASVLLLAVMIGAAYLAKARKKQPND